MVRSIEGIWRDGKVELLEPAPPVRESRVIIIFLSADRPVDLSARGVTPEQAADLRGRLESMAQEWQRPEMDAYDEL